MKNFLVLLFFTAISAGLAYSQTDESKKEYFAYLDSTLTLARENPDAALEQCTQIAEHWGMSSDVLFCRGVCRILKNQYETAATDLTLGASIWKKDDYYRIGAFYKALTSIFSEVGDYDNALKYANKGIKADKNFYTLYYQRGDIYHRMGKYKKAIADYKKASNDEDYYCDVKAEIALCYAEMGDPAPGEKALEESLQRNNYHGESRRIRALYALAKKDVNSFIDDYMMYMQISKPSDPIYIFDVCQIKDNYDYAKHYAKEILAGQEDSIDIAYWEWVLAMVEINIGNTSESWKHTQRAVAMNPGNLLLDTKLWYSRASHYSIEDNMDSLLIALDTLISRDRDDNYALHTAKGRVLTKQQKFNEAVASYQNALRMEIEDPDEKKVIFFRLADLYHNQLKDADKAIAYYDSLLTMDPTMTTIMYQLGKVYTRMKKDTAKANQVYSAIVEQEKKQQLNSNTMSQFALAQMGRYSEAEAMQQKLDEYTKTADKDVRGGMLYNAACLYSIIGKTDFAIEKLMEAMDEGILGCQQMKDDEDFNNIRNDESYKAIEKMICSAEEK